MSATANRGSADTFSALTDAEEELLPARLADLADVLDEWILVADANLELRYANPAARAGLALPPLDGLHAIRIVDLIANDRRADVVEQIRKGLVNTNTWTGELVLASAEGRRVELECTIVAHRDRRNRVEQYSLLGREVTNLRSAQRGLAMLSRAIESTPDLVTFHDNQGRMFFANRSARAFFGIGEGDDIPTLAPSDFLDTTPVQLGEIARTLQSNDQWSGELRAVHADGRRVPVEVVVVAHRDERQRVEYYSALTRDVSERKHADAARRRSETVLRAIVQSSPLAIFALDRNGVVHVWNHAAEALFGWIATDVVGRPPPFLTDESGAEFDDVMARVFRGRTVKGYLSRFARNDGGTVDVDVSIAPLRNAEGRVVSAVAVLADVSEQRHATDALLRSEVWFRSLVQHSTDMVMVVGTDGLVTYVSPGAAEFAGLTPAQALNRRADEVFSFVADDLVAIADAFERLRSTPGSTERITFRSPRADGELRWIEMAASNLNDEPNVRGIVCNARDVTDAIEADLAVRGSEERLRTLLSSVSDAIVVISAEGEVAYSSPVADAMIAESDDIFSALDPSDIPRAVELWEKTRNTRGVSPPAEVRIRAEAGGWLDTEVIANNLLDDPHVHGIVMTIRDVTERRRAERALRESESRLRESEAHYRAVVDDQIELVCRYLPDTTLTFVNRAFADFYGRARTELIGSFALDLQAPASRQRHVERLSAFTRDNAVQTYDEWILGADGTRRCYRYLDRAFLDTAGNVVEVQSVGHDVTEERRASVLTSNQAKILELVARGVPLDETLHQIACTVEEHFPKISCAVYLLDTEAETLRLAASPTLPRDVVADGGLTPTWSTPILGADGHTTLGTVVGFARERVAPDNEHLRISSLVAQLAAIAIERKAFEERLAHESMHDPLTGLPNRLLFLDRLELAMARGRRTGERVAVLFLDLDRFKNVNDSVGHDAGDELLVAVARRLESVLRPGDTVARFGGDEFTVLCEDVPGNEAGARAVEISDRLLAALTQPFIVRDTETFVAVSIGIALATTGRETPDELLRDADAAMYQAKEAGRGRAELFDDAIRARALERHATENALHRAIERGELRLFFQPIVRLADARCVGAEALVRWQHPDRGLVPPAEFVPLAEETGLIVPLGSWVLEAAAAQAARWHVHAADFSVSINLSARQLGAADLVDQVRAVIEHSSVAPSTLCFEITETALMDEGDAVMRVVEGLRGLGVRFAIDDFGTGYSSLGYLKRFAVDSVKIDRAFIAGLADDAGDHAIVSAVIGLAHALGLSVVAEGVETEAQLAELISLGCDEAQGYFFAPPQPADDLRGLVSTTRRWRPPGSTLMGRA